MARRLAGEDGLSLVEVMVAVFIGLLGALGVAQIISASERNSYRTEQSQVITNLMQAELERIKELPYAKVALTSAPVFVNDQRHPSWRVDGGNFALRADGSEKRPLVVNGGSLAKGGVVFGGAVDPKPSPFTNGDVSGAIHRYIVWMDDPGCPDRLGPGEQDLKRVVVAATLDESNSGERLYQEVHTDVADPDAVPVENALPAGAGAEGTFATFWLTDTPCSESARQPLTGSHPARNTLGVCEDGPASESRAGAPDLLSLEPPPLADGSQALFDYSTDVEPEVQPDGDKGLQLRPSQCDYRPGDQPQSHHRIHRWLSPRVPAGSEFRLGGEATLSLWSRTVNAASHPAEICVFLFVRRPSSSGGMEDVLFTNEGAEGNAFAHFEGQWPRDWREIAIDMDFGHSEPSIRAGERLGIAVTGAEGGSDLPLEFMYDNPSFDTRLAVKTAGELPKF